MTRTIAITAAAIVILALIVWATVISVSVVKKFDAIESRIEDTLRVPGDSTNSAERVREMTRKMLLKIDSLKKIDSVSRK
jgi:predicted DNA-binding helix-hairpin-helix protein